MIGLEISEIFEVNSILPHLRKNLGRPHLVYIATWAEGKGGKHKMWAGQFYFRGVYTIFHHTRAENSNSRF